MSVSYLLDTSVLVEIITDSPCSRWAEKEFNLSSEETPTLTSIVSSGEVLKLAKHRGWGQKKLDRMDKCLEGYLPINIDSSHIIDAYATIGAWSERARIVAPDWPPLPYPAVRMGKNDLWIAATAHALNLTVLSTDRGFEFLDKKWIDYIYIDRKNRLRT